MVTTGGQHACYAQAPGRVTLRPLYRAGMGPAAQTHRGESRLCPPSQERGRRFPSHSLRGTCSPASMGEDLVLGLVLPAQALLWLWGHMALRAGRSWGLGSHSWEVQLYPRPLLGQRARGRGWGPEHGGQGSAVDPLEPRRKEEVPGRGWGPVWVGSCHMAVCLRRPQARVCGAYVWPPGGPQPGTEADVSQPEDPRGVPSKGGPLEVEGTLGPSPPPGSTWASPGIVVQAPRGVEHRHPPR